MKAVMMMRDENGRRRKSQRQEGSNIATKNPGKTRVTERRLSTTLSFSPKQI